MTTENTNTTSSETATKTIYVLYKLEDGKKLYLCNAPKCLFGKSEKRQPWMWTKEKTALGYKAECEMHGIYTEIEKIEREMPTHMKKNAPETKIEEAPEQEIPVVEEAKVEETIKSGPVRDAHGRFVKKQVA